MVALPAAYIWAGGERVSRSAYHPAVRSSTLRRSTKSLASKSGFDIHSAPSTMDITGGKPRGILYHEDAKGSGNGPF